MSFASKTRRGREECVRDQVSNRSETKQVFRVKCQEIGFLMTFICSSFIHSFIHLFIHLSISSICSISALVHRLAKRCVTLPLPTKKASVVVLDSRKPSVSLSQRANVPRAPLQRVALMFVDALIKSAYRVNSK